MAIRDSKELSPGDIWSMLLAIDAHDRDCWLKIGMALKSELGDNGFSLFDDWSQTADNYNTKDARSVWSSFRGSGVGIGTLIQLARQSGWRGQAPARPTPAPRQAPKPKQSNTGRYAAELWLAANKWLDDDAWLSNPSPDESVITHSYAISKGIDWAAGAARGRASGSIIGKNADCIIVPIREHGTGKVQAVECIHPQGAKQTFGPKSGGYLLLGNTLDKSIPWYVCEGWASTVSTVFHHLHGNGVCACSFGKAAQRPVAESIAEFHEPKEVIILEEDDS